MGAKNAVIGEVIDYLNNSDIIIDARIPKNIE